MCLQERFQGISDTRLKLLPYAGIQTINLPFSGENVSPVSQKIWEEDGIVTLRPVREFFSETIRSNW